MTLLHQRLQIAVGAWVEAGYPHPHYRALGEMLAWSEAPEQDEFRLRPPQLRALTTYWYLRLVRGTPHILHLYQQLFPDQEEWLAALQLPRAVWQAVGKDQETLWKTLRDDAGFVARYKLESLRESATLRYPSYIFALAMGVGKTALIGSIIASEFALALAYPAGPFVHNALVFAPGRTILESLRELIAMPYSAILPPHLHRSFAAAVKFTVTQDGERDIAVLHGSSFNVILTNTEKIRIQKEKVRKQQIGALPSPAGVEQARQEIANLRLQTIASLPHLAIFSDEAHHTYGQALSNDLKKVRKTVDYLADCTNVLCVVNTTGTPYFKRQPLRDVVVWYGLAEGIRDGILKEVADNIVAYDLPANGSTGAATSAADPVDQVITEIIADFFQRYGSVCLPDGTPAKLALYFPKTADVARARPAIERTLVRLGEAPTLLLEHHTQCENQRDFDRFRTRHSPHRIALLVDRGVEGWDVPALFACALVRKLKSSNNFVLQAAARCLRQTPGNKMPARIYLSSENRAILERQLRATYGESTDRLLQTRTATRAKAAPTVTPTRWPLPSAPREPKVTPLTALSFIRPQTPAIGVRSTNYHLADDGLHRTATTQQSRPHPAGIDQEVIDLYQAAVALAALYRLDLWLVYDALRTAYGAASLLPSTDLHLLCQQIEMHYATTTTPRRDEVSQ